MQTNLQTIKVIHRLLRLLAPAELLMCVVTREKTELMFDPILEVRREDTNQNS